MPTIRLVVRFLLGVLLLAIPARATWSIVIVDLATGEVAVGIATCLTNFDLRPNTVVVVPGYGVAAAQSFVGPLSLRQLIRTGLLNGDTAAQILAALAAADPGHQTRQYGIVSLTGGEVTFTGTGAGAWAGGMTGQAGTLRWAIQGNVLTGQPVVQAAEQAILTTPGSLPDKLMAAMEAARSFGGDGRCSCSPGNPTGCGSPPPSFAKSAHIALMIVARPSDLDAPCSGALGCGAGDYWLDLNVANQPASAPDPVIQLQGLYAAWQAQQVGRPDHYASTVTMSATTLRADGIDMLTGTIVLRDAQGNPLGNSLPVTVGLAPGSTVGNIAFGPVTPQPNGSYTFTMTGGFDAGNAIVDVSVTDPVGHVGLWPRPMITVTDLFGPCGQGAIPDGVGGSYDALRISGSGGNDRVVEVGYAQPFTISLDPPPGVPTAFPVGLFALWAHVGVPFPGTALPLGATNGAVCFTPQPFAPSPTVLLADSFGLGGTFFVPSAPWSLALPGLPAVLDVALQGVMVIDPLATFAATNAVYLRLVPLPAPAIAAVTPLSPTPGQTATVTGSDFYLGMAAAIGGAPVPVTVLSQSQAQFVMPAGVACDAPFVLANPGGPSAQTTINRTPVVSNSPAASGPAAGGTSYLIIGQNLLGVTVTFNGVPMPISANTASVVVGTTPPGTPGPATVVIQNANGCQVTRPFTYL